MTNAPDPRHRPAALSIAPFALLLFTVTACSTGRFPTLPLYETPNAFVRLEIDRTVGSGPGHDHPAAITATLMTSVLERILVVEPWARLPLYDDMSRPRRHRVFDERQVAFLAPVLAQGLNRSTPEEVVTFYMSRDVSGGKREVTSGGVFVKGGALHVILANDRSPTQYMADYGAADTKDDRLNPLASIAPQRGTLDFEPPSALVQETGTGWSWLRRDDRPKLAVRYSAVPPAVPAQDVPSR